MGHSHSIKSHLWTHETGAFFLGWILESQWLRHCLHDWMSSVILFLVYLCEQHLLLLSRFLCGSGRGSSVGAVTFLCFPSRQILKGHEALS